MFKAFRLTAAAAVTAAALISGCSLAPDYERPSMPEGAFWSGDTAAGIPDWQKQFSSAELSRLIDQALKTNRDLKLAILNVAAYEAKYRITRADLLPSLNGAAGSTRSKVSDSQSNMTNIYSTQYNVGLNVGWELDFFGKIRNQKEAAVEQYLAEQENRKSAQMSIIAAVADAYYTLVADRNLLEISKRTLKTEEESSALVKQQLDSGAVSDLTYVQAQTAVDQARITTANYARLPSIDLSSLSVLVGAEIPSDTGSSVSLLDLSLPAFPVAAPSSLLERRPDIMAAEHNLRAANASIGAARAAFFPSISLNAGVGSISPEMNELFGTSRNGYWSIGPAITVPIFNGGRLKGSLDLAKIQKEAAVVTYQKTIRDAFKEVYDSIVSQKAYTDQFNAASSLRKSTERYFNLADTRYRNGVDSYLTRLDAERAFFSAQTGEIGTKLAQLINDVTLYKALGGGWHQGDDASAEEIRKKL